jgi:ankyrin repeat protein
MPTLNLEYYRKQAKSLLHFAQTGDAAALERIALHRGNVDPAQVKLHDAQLAIAREQGFASWPKFREFVEQSGLDDQSLVDAFIDAATSDLKRADESLAANPKIARAGFYVALVLGNSRQVGRAVAKSPQLATRKSGPQKCEPLIYTCFSRYANPAASKRAAGLVGTARVLLLHGADPNTTIVTEDFPDSPLSCLYAATGLNNNVALAELLLDSGAKPNDGESLYHSTEHHDLECMKLLLRHGATPQANDLKHMLDREDAEGVRLLLAAGANPNQVPWAVWRGRSATVIAALLDAGADANEPRLHLESPYAMALRNGQHDVAELLAAHGADTTTTELDRYLAAPDTTPPPRDIDWQGRERLLSDLAMNHRTNSVRALLAAGGPIDSRGEHGGTALHWACWKGYADLVELLLNAGASLTIEDYSFHATPAGWLDHGRRTCHEGAGDYAAVARLLGVSS